jgi:4-hydroxybenzoate polyprenyltransferase
MLYAVRKGTGSCETNYINAALMKNILGLIRWPNLLLLGGIQSVVYFTLLDHMLSVLNVTDLVLMILITIMLGAGGYVINDYYDHHIDEVNKPQKWIAGKRMSLTAVKNFYFLISAVGFACSIWLASRMEMWRFLFIYPLAATGLWWYSKKLKCTPIAGNLWVSLYCAFVIGIVAFPDYILQNFNAISRDFLYYMGFAFTTTWMREIVKDMEDADGDMSAGCQTFVVRHGHKASARMVVIIGVLLIAGIMFWERHQSGMWVRLCLIVLQGGTVGVMTVLLPSCFFIVKIHDGSGYDPFTFTLTEN